MPRKRPDKDGSITFKKDKKLWYVRITDDRTGKRVGEYHKAHEDARKALEDMRARKNANRAVVYSRETIIKFMPEWLEHAKETVRPVTFEGYAAMVRLHIIPNFGTFRLNALTGAKITDVLFRMKNRESNPVSVSNLKHLKAILSTALNWARKHGKIGDNPCDDADMPIDNQQAQTFKIIDQEQLSDLLSYIRQHDPEHYPIVYIASATGMRRSELCALQWKDIDFTHNTITVERTVRWKKGIRSEFAPKTKKGRRNIALSVESMLFLKSYRETQEAYAADHNYQVKNYSPIFRFSSTGAELKPDNVTHAFKRNAVRFGLDDFHFHNLRHTHASILLKRNVHTRVVQERLGHSSAQITMDIYSHVTHNMQSDAVDNLEILNNADKIN